MQTSLLLGAQCNLVSSYNLITGPRHHEVAVWIPSQRKTATVEIQLGGVTNSQAKHRILSASYHTLPGMASTSTLPVLLPASVLPSKEESPFEWKPRRSLLNPPPPPPEDMTPEQEAAAAKLSIDGKFRKVRPRRTVDYGGPMGRWTLVSL